MGSLSVKGYMSVWSQRLWSRPHVADSNRRCDSLTVMGSVTVTGQSTQYIVEGEETVMGPKRFGT